MRKNITKIVVVLLFLGGMSTVQSATGSASVSDVSAGGKLSVKIEFPKRCMFGDMDAIVHDMMWSDKQKLLFSLMPIAGSEGKGVATEIMQEISNGEIEPEEFRELLDEGYEFKIDLPEKKVGKYVAVVCKDSANTGSCRGKAVRDINDILKDYANPARDFVPADNVYFYQPLVLTEKTIEYVAANNPKDAKQGLAKLVSAKTATDAETVSSLPLEVQENALLVKLPRFDKIKCGQ